MTPEEWTKRIYGTDGCSWGFTPKDIAAAIRAAVEEEREACAEIAQRHKGAAQKRRRDRGQKLSLYEPFEQNEIVAEERGEDIAADIIAAAIRKRGES